MLEHREHDEGGGCRAGDAGRGLAGLHADLDQHQREFADLRKIDGGQQARAQTLPHHVERREHRHEPARQREGHENSARPSTEAVGSGIVMPSATKNSVMKKSRSDVPWR